MAELHTRERLLVAAREVVAKEGLEGLTLRAIARQAGVSHGAPLRHFPTLASLLSAVAAQGFSRLIEAVDEALADAEAAATAAGPGRPLRALERLAIAGEAYVTVAVADPGVFSITFRPERCDTSDPDYLRVAEASFGQLVGLVEAAQAEGWQPGEPPRLVAGVLWTQVHGTAELLLHGALAHAIAPHPVGELAPVARRLLLGLGSDPLEEGRP
jgi:AcrR family transcriptional regulator